MIVVITIIVILVVIRLIARTMYNNRMKKAAEVFKKIPEMQPKGNVYYTTPSSMDDIILLNTKVIANVVLDCVHKLRLNKEKSLSHNNLQKLINKIFEHEDISANLPYFDCIWTQTTTQMMLAVTSEPWSENKMPIYPWTVAALLTRWYATELLWWYTPSSSLTNKMVEIVNSKFVNLWKL